MRVTKQRDYLFNTEDIYHNLPITTIYLFIPIPCNNLYLTIYLDYNISDNYLYSV